jgi:hypothetical protein
MNMSKVNAKNERTKRAFFRWLKNADGRCDSTVDCVESAILLWQEFSRDEDFAFYNADKGIAFKNWLSKRETHGKRLSLVTFARICAISESSSLGWCESLDTRIGSNLMLLTI